MGSGLEELPRQSPAIHQACISVISQRRFGSGRGGAGRGCCGLAVGVHVSALPVIAL